MKAIRLLIAAVLLTTSAVSAKRYTDSAQEVIFFVDDTPSTTTQIYQYDSPELVEQHVKEKIRKDMVVKEKVVDKFIEYNRTGYQSTLPPLLLFTQKDNKFSFAVGGFISLRTSYDFNGIVDNIDFVTADIPIPGNYATRQQLMMDASTSRIYVRSIINSRALGEIEVFADMDFRGGTGYSDGVTNKYTPRVRSAYVSFLGITMGRDVTTFCDLDAAPETIDFQGPNAYSFNYATLLRYTHTFCNDRLEAAIALEQPKISGTYGTNYASIPQRLPDVPFYFEYKMGQMRQHHIRASAVVRDMYMYKLSSDSNTTHLGWGVKLSGHLEASDVVSFFFNGTYGEGITQYIQDLNGMGLDFIPDPSYPESIKTPTMYAWQASAKFNITDRLHASGGYSTVEIEKYEGDYSSNEYHVGQYVFGNIFYDATPRLKLACEYLYGTRKDMDYSENSANRASIMAQFSF